MPANYKGVVFPTPQGARACIQGLSGYRQTPTPWGWEYYPPPYRFASPYPGPGGVTPDYGSAAYFGLSSKVLSNGPSDMGGLSGLGCGGDGCTCGGSCSGGMGQVDLSFLNNTFSVASYQVQVWIGLAVGIGAIALYMNSKKR